MVVYNFYSLVGAIESFRNVFVLMNVLITNTQEDQAYLIARCLREEADRIVIAMDGRSLWQRWSALAPWSRYVDKRYRTPEPGEDWWAGRIQRDNSPAEEAYIRRIEEICRAERIDVVFPSFDPDIYVLSKNKARLADQGVVVVGPDYDQLLIPMNKLRTVEVAEEAGFPCPLTFVPAGPEDLDEVIEQVGPPWVIKPRFTAHGMEIRIVTRADELRRVYADIHQRQARPLVQEYIPGYKRRNYYVVINRNLDIISLLCPQVIRARHRGVSLAESACTSSNDAPNLSELRELLRRLGYWGCMSVQTVVDARDGIPKLMEINPRLGDRLWYRMELGVNEPLLYLRLAQYQPLPKFDRFPEGVHIVDPISDLRNLGDRVIESTLDRFRRLFGLPGSIPDYRVSQPISALLASMGQTYFSATETALAPYVRNLFTDPVPCALHNIKVLAGMLWQRRYFSRGQPETG